MTIRDGPKSGDVFFASVAIGLARLAGLGRDGRRRVRIIRISADAMEGEFFRRRRASQRASEGLCRPRFS
jgi:hypothetical protein